MWMKRARLSVILRTTKSAKGRRSGKPERATRKASSTPEVWSWRPMTVSSQRSAALASFGLKHRTNCERKKNIGGGGVWAWRVWLSQEREVCSQRWESLYSGPQPWHRLAWSTARTVNSNRKYVCASEKDVLALGDGVCAQRVSFGSVFTEVGSRGIVRLEAPHELWIKKGYRRGERVCQKRGLTESGERSIFIAMTVSSQRSPAFASLGCKHRTNCEWQREGVDGLTRARIGYNA